jgi:hypothetical protein
LRLMKKEDLNKPAMIYAVKDALMFIESSPLGVRGKGFLGESHFMSPNPQVGAVFTYYLKDDLKTLKDKRRDAEKEKIKKGESVFYPSIDTMRLEDMQPDPYVLFTVSDEAGQVVRRLKAPAKKGLQRIVWNFRYASNAPAGSTPPDAENVFANNETGYLAMPGTYKVSLSKFEDGIYSELVPPQSFKCVALNNATLAATDKKEYDAFCKKVSDLRRVAGGVNQFYGDLNNRIKMIETAILDAPKVSLDLQNQLFQLKKRLEKTSRDMYGDATLAKREFETTPSVNSRIMGVQSSLWGATSAPSESNRKSYDIASKLMNVIVTELNNVNSEIEKVEKSLDAAGAPYTPGRAIEWKN